MNLTQEEKHTIVSMLQTEIISNQHHFLRSQNEAYLNHYTKRIDKLKQIIKKLQ